MRVVVLACVALLLFSPCFCIDLLTREIEIRIGRQAAVEIEKEYGGVVSEGVYVERVQRIGFKISSVCQRKDIAFSFKVLNNEKWLNAVSLPGGYVYVTKKLVERCSTDDELAFVIGHEVAHIAMKHARKQISERLALSMAASLFAGDSDVVRVGVAIALTLHERGYSRLHEREADKYGTIYMMQVGYNPIGAMKVLRMFIKMESSRDDAITRLLRTHPHPKERLKYVRAVISKYGSKYGFDLQSVEEQLKKEEAQEGKR